MATKDKELGRNASYWDNRRLNRFSQSEKRTSSYIKSTKKIYSQAYKDINKMLEDVYRNYSNETGIDKQKLKEYITKSETKKGFDELQKLGYNKYVKDNYKSRITKLEQLKMQIYKRVKEITPKEQLKSTELYKDVINDEYYRTIYDTQTGSGINFSFNEIDDNVVNSLLNEKWHNSNYSERIWGNTDALASQVNEIIGGALLSGQGIEKTSRQIRERFDVGEYYSRRLARTEMAHFNNQADAMAYEEMGIKEYVCVATLDSRTSPYCIDIDGKHFKYSEMKEGDNYPPFHPNCRCTTRAYLGEEAEKNIKRRARNPITGKNEVINNMSYKEWRKSNGLDIQKFASGSNSLSSKKQYKNITSKWMSDCNLNYKETKNAEFVIKNDKKYEVNNKNKIKLENREKLNGEWFVNQFGGRIEYLPVINEDENVECSDYMYYKSKNDKGIFIEEKETNGTGKNVFYHALEGKENQSDTFLIDCTDSKLTNDEIYERINRVFTSKKTQYVNIIFIKNNDKLFGIFQNKKR